jgi:hypothetical protein
VLPPAVKTPGSWHYPSVFIAYAVCNQLASLRREGFAAARVSPVHAVLVQGTHCSLVARLEDPFEVQLVHS